MKRLLNVLGLLLACAPLIAAQEARRVTVDWIFSDEGESLSKLPSTFWTSDGSLLILDGRKAKGERTIERVRPETGARSVAVRTKTALDGLRSMLGGKDAPDALAWPESFDTAGRRAVYVFADDLFLLDLGSSRFERLTKTGEKEELPRLSPDGKRLAFVRGNDLHVLDLTSRAETRVTRDGSPTVLNGKLSWVYWEEVFGRNDTAYWWSEDGAALAFLRTDEASVSTVVFPDFTPAVPRVIEQRYPKAGGTNPSVRLGVVELGSGKTVWADPSVVAYEYIVQVKWHPDGERVAFETMNRAQDRTDLYLLTRGTGAVAHVFTETDPAWVYTLDYHFLRDGTVVCTSDRTGQTHLYRFDAKGQLLNPVTSGPWSVRGPAGFMVAPQGAATVDEGRGVVYFTGRQKSASERQLYRVGLDGTGMEPLSKEEGIHVVEWSRDRRFYVDRRSSRRTPPALSLHAADGTTKAVLAGPQSELLGAAFRYPEAITIPAADGRPLLGHILKPAGFDPSKRHPLIVHVYGEPNAPLVEDRWGGTDDAVFPQALLDAGYVVASVDSRVATGASKADVSGALRRTGGDGERDDLVAAVRWLKTQPGIDPERVGVWGWSGGGTTTLLLLTRSTEFKAGIAVAPVTDRSYYDTKYVEASMKTPESNPDGYEQVSLVKRAKDLHGRLLLVHGTHDDNVHPQNTWHFVDELVKAGKPVDMMIYPMRKHDIADRPARRHLYGKMLEFWKTHL
jgi:dipeptidyl-peptidase 4